MVERGPLEADVSGSNPDGTTTLLYRTSVVRMTLDHERLVRFQLEQPGIPAEPNGVANLLGFRVVRQWSQTAAL